MGHCAVLDALDFIWNSIIIAVAMLKSTCDLVCRWQPGHCGFSMFFELSVTHFRITACRPFLFSCLETKVFLKCVTVLCRRAGTKQYVCGIQKRQMYWYVNTVHSLIKFCAALQLY